MENSHEHYSTMSRNMQVPFRIDPEFEGKIPKIGEDEFKQLRENILSIMEVTEPLTIWNGILIDGHNRWKVIQESPEVKWRTREMNFPDKWAAFEWMYKNQLGRRNLTDEQRTYTIGKMKEARKKSIGGQGANQHTVKEQLPQNGVVAKKKYGTAAAIAREIGVGRNTVDRAEKFAKGVDVLRNVSPEAADKVLEGKSKITKTEVADLAKSEPEIIEAFAQAVNEGKRPERKPRKPKTEEEKQDMAEIEAIMADMRDPTTTPEFTIDYLIEDIEINGQTYVELLANTLKDRNNLVTNENKPRIAAAIDKVVESIMKVREQI